MNHYDSTDISVVNFKPTVIYLSDVISHKKNVNYTETKLSDTQKDVNNRPERKMWIVMFHYSHSHSQKISLIYIGEKQRKIIFFMFFLSDVFKTLVK